MSCLDMNKLYPASSFNPLNNGNVYHDFVIFTVENNLPKIVFQHAGTNNPIRSALAINSNPSTCYIIQENDQYRLIVYSNVSTMAIAYFDPSFREWMSTNVSVLMENQNIIFNNGPTTYTNVFVTKKKNADPNNTMQYAYITQPNVNYPHTLTFWSDIDTTNLNNYINNIGYQYDVRFYAQKPSWFSDSIVNSIRSIENPNVTVPSVTITVNSLYDPSVFSSITTTYHDFVIFSASNNIPSVTFQPKNTSTIIKSAITNNNNPCYVIMEGTQYRVITFSNVNTLAIAYYDQSFKTWINSNNCYLFDNVNVQLGIHNYSSIFVSRSPTADPTKNTYTYITEYNPLYPNTSIFWTDVDISNIEQYEKNISNNYDIKFFISKPSWYSNAVVNAINDVISTYNNVPNITPGNPLTISNSSNIIYTKSLYNQASGFFDSTINRLIQENQEEESLRDVLNNNTPNLLFDIQQFIDTKSIEINNKLNEVESLKTSLISLINMNQQQLINNHDLNTLISSPSAVDLSDKITSLKNSIYNTIQFLISNNRYGPNSDIVYLINKVSL